MKAKMERFKGKKLHGYISTKLEHDVLTQIKTKAYCGEEIDILNQKQKPTCLQ